MLGSMPITLILPVIDMERAQAFYEQALGLSPQGLNPDGKFIFAAAGGAHIALIQRDGGTKAEHTAVSFEVADVEAAINALEARGVVFHDYDFPGLTTINHIALMGAEKAAWFNDTEGNILCIHEVIG
jgi:predicted enzyme related to lactoylglutathione lyase